MRRKSDRKSKTSPEKKTPERPSRLTLRRRRQKSVSSSPEREKKAASENEIDSTPLVESNVGSKETSNSNSEEEKQEEQPVWQVKSAETPPGGEIQKLKICLQRPSSTPERAEKSPRRHRKHRGGTSSITDEDSSEGKVKSKSSRKRRHQDNDEEIVESSSEDKVNKIHQMVKDEQNSSDSQQVSSTDIDENSKLCDKEDTTGTPPPGELNEEIVGTTSLLQKSMSEDDNTSHHNGPESTTVIEETVENTSLEETSKVEHNPHVEDTIAKVEDISLVEDTSQVVDNSLIEDNSQIVDNSQVVDNSLIEDNSQVENTSQVEDNSNVNDSSQIENSSRVNEDFPVENHPQLVDSSTTENSQCENNSKVEANSGNEKIVDQLEKSSTPELIHQEVITNIEEVEKTAVKKVVESVETDSAQVKDTEILQTSETIEKSIQVFEPSETKSEEKSETFKQDTIESRNQEVEKSHTPEPRIKETEVSNLDKIQVEENIYSVNEIKSNDSKENVEKPQKLMSPEKTADVEEDSVVERCEKKSISPEKMDVDKEETNEKSENINNEIQTNQENDKTIAISRETNDSSGDDESPVPSSIVSVVNQVPSTYESEPIEEQSTYVADPTRKKLKLREAISEYVQAKSRLTSEHVREICPDLKVLSLDEIRLEDDIRNHNDDDAATLRKTKKKPFEDKKITIQTVKEFTTAPTVLTTPPITTNPMLANRKISIVGDESNNLHRPPSPAKNEPSSILYIKNLVRPFTLNQLKELLSRTGSIKENGFWINKIKSECYVHYETLEQSVETRNALHGVHWPVANGRRLDVDFGTEEAMEKARKPTEIKHEIKTEVPATPEAKPKEEPVDWREVRERERLRREQRGVREWDVGKQGPERSPSPPPTKRRQHTPPSRNASPERKTRKKEDVPSKLLDDLFRKTKATPCIYWLPLSAEMIVIKEEQRRKHMAEHERRLAEIRRVERMRRAPGGGRNRDGGRSRYN